jgi:hypothetical protein
MIGGEYPKKFIFVNRQHRQQESPLLSSTLSKQAPSTY